MSVLVHGELSADGKNVVIMAAGPDYAVAKEAKKLALITPLVSKSDPPGALLMPLSWPGCVQIAFTFGRAWVPGPKLTQWLMRQVSMRTGHQSKEIRYQLPAAVRDLGHSLYWWQEENVKAIAHCGGALITDDPGLGKTQSAIIGLAEREQWGHQVTPIVAVVPPGSMIDAWVRAFELWAPHWKTVAWRGTPAQRQALAGTADVYIVGYAMARKDAAPGISLAKSPLARVRPMSVIADEIQNCFLAGTLVATPTGPRAIESLREGDAVIGLDHATGLPAVTRVQQTFKRATDQPLISVNGVTVTPGHPVWTTRGYLPASQVKELDTVCAITLRSQYGELHSDVRMVPACVSEKRQSDAPNPLLQHELFGQVAYVKTGLRRVTGYSEAERDIACPHATIVERKPRRHSGAASVSGQRAQPVQRSSRTSESASERSGDRLREPDRRERAGTYQASILVGGTAGLAHGGSGAHQSQESLAVVVQDRRRTSCTNGGDRGGRGGAQQPESARARRQENATTHRAGLDGSAIHESPDSTGNGCGGNRDIRSRTVYNIETGTHNYVAGGLLVHNCNNPDAVQTRAVQRLVGTASAFVPMSGTPVTHSVKGLWPTLKVFEPGAFPAGERFVTRYALEVAGDYGAAEIIGLNPMTEPEFRTVLLGRMLRHNKRVCLPDLPDKVYSVREVEIPAAYKKAYRGMEEKMVAELPDGGEITVMGTLAKIIRLQQMSSAAADVEPYFELDDATGEMKEKQKVTLRMPSWKVDALLEVLTERPGTQTLVFAPSRQLLVLAGKAAEKAGYRVGYVMGGQNIVKERTPTIDAFQAGEIDVMFIVSSAGGAGLTLTKASTEVFLQRPYSFVESTQCEDRGWGRVDGSALKSVEIIDIRAKGTIDGRIPAILYDKAEQTSELLRDPRIVAELLGGNTRRHLQAVS